MVGATRGRRLGPSGLEGEEGTAASRTVEDDALEGEGGAWRGGRGGRPSLGENGEGAGRVIIETKVR